MKDILNTIPSDLQFKIRMPKTTELCNICHRRLTGNMALVARISVKRRRGVEIAVCSESCRVIFVNDPESVTKIQNAVKKVLSMKNLR